MELSKLREMIANNDLFKSNPEFQEFAEHFEILIELFQLQKEGVGESEEFLGRFGHAFQKFWGSFDKVASAFGFSPELLKANLDNPAMFHPEQWKAMQALKQEITGEKTADAAPIKKRKDKKRVRI